MQDVAPLSFGTAYYPDHWPEADWGRDLDRIAAAGLTMVRFGEFSWSWYEPQPGKFDFRAFDRFVGLVEARGLKLCLCTPTATPPPWFDRLFPDGRLLDMNGRRCLSHRHFWSWNHRRSWTRAVLTITRLAERYRDRRCFWGWQIDNEPNYAEEINLATPERMYDFNPEARRDWVAWLKTRYGSLTALNEAWWTNFWSQRYGTWDELLPARGRTNPHAWLDWMRWREANVAAFVARQRDLLRELTPGKAIGCNIPETGAVFSLAIGQDYWAQAEGLDWVGTDLYQATGNRRRDLAKHAYSTDLMRSAAAAAGARFFISETQAGPHERAWPNTFAGEGFGPDYLEDCAKVFATRGAEQIWWFLWRPTLGGHEIGMNGVQALDGGDTPRTAVVRKLARESAGLAKQRRQFLRRPRALVHYSRDSLRLASAFSANVQDAEETLFGWHRLLESAGWRVDFVSDAGLPAALDEEPRLLVLPFSMMLTDAAAARLAAYSGRVIAGPHTGICDEHGRLRAAGLAAPLAQAWDVRYGLWRDVGELPKLAGGQRVSGWRELLPGRRPRVRARLSNRAPLIVTTGNATLTAIDFGVRAAQASNSELAGLRRSLALG